MTRQIGGVRKCTNKECRNLTRTSTQTLTDHPGTLIRMRGGLCVQCYQPAIPPCISCGTALRKSSVPPHLAPGTKVRHAEGLCKVCWRAKYPPTPEIEITPEQLAHTMQGLEAYMARRRQRIEAMA